MAVSAGMALLSSTTALATGTLMTAAFGMTAFVTTFAFNFALGAALNALTPKPSLGGNRGYQVNSRGSALDHQIIYGKVRVGGAIVYDEATGDDNEYLHRIIAVSGHEIESFDRIYINDSYVDYGDIDEDGNVSQVTDSDGNTSSRYDGKLRIKFKFGTANQTAEDTLVNESDGLWTTDCRLRGIAYMYIRMEFDADVYPNGVPTFTAEVKGKKLYNPATDTTAWSDNPALCIRDYLTSSYGLEEEAVNIDDTLVASAVAVCNQTNTDAGTTRYTCNGAFTTNLTPYDALNNLLTSMGGTLWYAQGKWRMKPAYWTTPVLNLTEDDLRSAVSVATRHSRRDNFNTVKGTFRGAESGWQTTDYPEVKSDASITADGGQVSVADVDLPFTDNSIEARRTARIALERNRQQLTISASFGIGLLQVQVGDNIRLSNTRFGWDNKEFEVLSWNFGLTDDLDLQTDLVLRETAESVFDEVDDGAAYERDNTNLPSPFMVDAPQNLTVSDGGFVADDGTYVNSFIVDWNPPADAFVDYYVLEWKTQAGSVYKGTNLTATEYEISPVREDVTYDIRVKAVNVFGASGPYASTTAQVGGDTTAPSVPTSLEANGDLGFIEVNWVNPADSDLNYVKVFESVDNNVTNASLVGRSSGDNFIRSNLSPLVTRYYWVSAVDFSGNESAKAGPQSATTRQITAADIGPAIIGYDDFASDVTALFADIEADIGQLTTDTVALDADVTTLQSDFTTLDGAVTANSTAVSGIETRVTEAEGEITASASQITALESSLTTLDGEVSGNATAISGLDTRVTDAEGTITAQASAITSISTTVDGNTTSVTEALTSIDGIEGKYGVTIDNNGSITGYQLLSGAGGSAFNVRADQFAVFNSTGGGGDNPFTVFTSSRTIDGVVYPAGTYIENAYIDIAAIVDLSVDTIKIKDQAISNTGVDEGTLSASNTTTYRTVASVTL